MHQWIETHGWEVLVYAGLFSLVMSSAPPPPVHWGFWELWAYKAGKALGANADNLIKHPEQFQQLVQHTEETKADGTQNVVDTQATSIPKTQ